MVERTNFDKKADDLVAQADKKLKGNILKQIHHFAGGFFKNLMQAKSDRMDEAKELFQQAANCYKLSKNWEAAVETLKKCIDCSPPDDDRDLGGLYHEMANCVKNVSSNKYLEYSRIAIDKYSLSARLGQAANLAKQCGELMFEQNDYEEAILFFEKAADLYLADETPTQGY